MRRRDQDILHKHPFEVGPGMLPIMVPQNIPEGFFLHHVNSSGFPVLAEGILLEEKEKRSGWEQKCVSGRFNEVEEGIIHASHMIANCFGGSPYRYNLLALPEKCNRFAMGNFEKDLARKMQSGKLYLQVFAAYVKPENQIASDVLYRVYDVINGKPAGISRDHSFFALH
jgi:DNA/RNA non-specific endonuclease